MLYYIKLYYIKCANIAWASTNKTKLKNNLRNKSKLRVSYLIKIDLRLSVHYLRLLNALNVYQINLLQVILFMHKIKTNSSPWIFLHPFQTINYKYATRYF